MAHDEYSTQWHMSIVYSMAHDEYSTQWHMSIVLNGT